jgi:hypothetical protein
MSTRGGSRPSVFKNPIAIAAAIISVIASIGASAQSARRRKSEFSDEWFKSFWAFERREANRELP